MRMLFTFVGGTGHFNPLIPIARAARAAGHTVAVACRASMAPVVEAAGFPAIATGAAPDQPRRRGELQPPDAAHEAQVVRRHFAGRMAKERADTTLAVAAAWRPDLIVCDEMDFGAIVAAERLGLPYATVIVIAAGGFVPPALVREPLTELRASHGLPPDPDLTMLSRYLVLAPVPPGYRDPADPLPATAHAIRPAGRDPVTDAVPPPWLAALDGAPVVYFTLGTEFNLESGDLLARVITGLRELPINLIVTVGHEIDPAELGPQPANVRIEQYVSQALLFPRCRLVVSHGGSGTVIGALAHGLPQVLLPMGADQMRNAARCLDLGVARALDVMTTTPASVREAVAALLADPAYHERAARIRDEIAALPGPGHAVALLERLATERRPIVTTE